jgi:pantoate--beta-alanine ligase
MGALHKGHLSLIERCQQDGNFTVVSIFVNPLQFSSEADYEGYPRTLGVDARLLTDASVDVLFAPSAAEVFPKEQSFPEIDPGVVGERFEGEFRPGHFAGMLKVVSRLLDIVVPDRAYFGEKDAQQVALVTQMVDAQVHSGRREPMSVVVCPTIRSEQGLALSSRNLRLSGAELESATELYGALVAGSKAGKQRAEIVEAAKAALSPAIRLEYLELVDASSFEIVERIPSGGARLIIAAWVGDVRLIDNLLIGGSK